MTKMQSRDYPLIREKVSTIQPILNEYRFEDLARTVFCINLYIKNRFSWESKLALDICLFEHDGKGMKTISSYDDFLSFFASVSGHLQPSIWEDHVIEDFGEVRLNVDGVFYRVILGSGYSNAFACLNFLPVLAKETSNSAKLKELLEYSSGLIDYFTSENISGGTDEREFSCPTELLYQRTIHFFTEELPKYDLNKLSSYIETDSTIIEERHFIKKCGMLYPLFRESLLLEIYNKWYQSIDEKQRIRVANTGIINRVFRLFEPDRYDDASVFAPAAEFREQKPVTSRKPFAFAARSSRGFMIAINRDEYTDHQLDKEIETIVNAHKNGELQIGEVLDRYNNKVLRAVQIPPNLPIVFILYDSYTNPLENYMHLEEEKRNDRNVCSALDLIYYLDFMTNLDELFEFITYQNSNDFEQMLAFGSEASLFFEWKKQEHFIAKGAIKYGFLNLGYDLENEAVVDYYRRFLSDYPFCNGDNLFSEPFLWNITINEEGNYSYTLKSAKGFGGDFVSLPKHNYAFLTHNVEYYNDVSEYKKDMNIVRFFDELIIEGLKTIRSLFAMDGAINKCGIQIIYMPHEYATKAGHISFLNENREYVYSEAIRYENRWQIVYTVKNGNAVFQAIQSATDRSAELKILREIFFPMLVKSYGMLEAFDNIVKQKSGDKKKVDVASISIDYIWNEAGAKYHVEAKHLHAVRKRIAQVCQTNNVEPGTYKGQNPNQIIRKMQRALVEEFEQEVSKYEWFDLHCQLLDYHATLLHEIGINRIRYHSYHDISSETEVELQNMIIQNREQAKKDDRNTLYLLETNLFLRNSSNAHATADDIRFLLAYANWLVVLNDVADICYWVDCEASVEITDEYLVNTIQEKLDVDEYSYLKRVYENESGLHRNESIDEKYIRKIEESFKGDLGFEFGLFVDILTYFSSECEKYTPQVVGENIYLSKRDLVLSDILMHTNDKYAPDEIDRALNYVSIETDSLKTVNGKEDFYLPIGRRRERNNRFELKPIVVNEGNIVFSPVAVFQLKQLWLDGLQRFIMPCENGLPNTKKVEISWKREYEKLIVTDIGQLFVSHGFDIVKKNFSLVKLSKEHPQYLGDYDVFAVNKKTRTVWIIECKVLELVGSFYEAYRQQYRFFYEHREDEKFQRRIDYMQNNLNRVLRQLGIDENDHYKVVPYMCMNKIMVSRYKKINFPIVSFYEFERLLDT